MKSYNKELLIINDEFIVIGMRFHSEPFVHFNLKLWFEFCQKIPDLWSGCFFLNNLNDRITV